MAEDFQVQIDALKDENQELRREIAALRRDLVAGEPRLGPRPETQEEEAERTKRIVDALNLSRFPKQEPPPVDRTNLCTTSGESVAQVRQQQAAAPATGMHKGYIVLCEEERLKGFVRPYRDRYQHVGPKICGRHVGPDGATVCYMDPGHDGECGVAKGPRPQACRTVTTMGRALSETYARDPKFYGATFCCGCNRHLPVGEFVWSADGQVVGS